MGCPAASAGAKGADAAPTFREIAAGFEQIEGEYPGHVGDDGEAFKAYCRALAALGDRIDAVAEAMSNLTLEHGEDVPDLAEALTMIERSPPRKTGRQ